MTLDQSTLSSEEALASRSQSLAEGSHSTENPDLCLSSFGLWTRYVRDGYFGKTSQGRSRRKAPKGSEGVLSDNSSTNFAEAGMAWRGEYWTASMPEYPTGWTDGSGQLHRGAGVSFLSDTLETRDVPERFFLSARACEGILRRAGQRGKSLPPLFVKALNQVVTRSKSEQENLGGGKGPLIQDDVSATLSTSQDQTLFQKVPAGFTISGFAQYKPDDAGTLRAAGGDLGGGSETLIVLCAPLTAKTSSGRFARATGRASATNTSAKAR